MRHLIDPLDFSQQEITSLLALADRICADPAAYQDVAAHKKLAQWEREGKLKAVITQNIDGLHQKAGSHEVLELHGSVLRNYCRRCGQSVMTIRHRHSTGMRCCSMKVEIKLFNACNTADNGEGFVCVQQIPPLLYMHFQKTTIGVGVYFTLC